TERGTVFTHIAHGSLQNGSEVEWREIALHMFDGDLLRRSELFDEADLDAALAKFDELHMQTRRLQNAASQAAERYTAHFAARDWGALAEVMAEDIVADDRRGVVNAGARRGRNAEIENMRAAADVGITHMKSAVIATRGERLVLSRVRTTSSDDGPERFEAEVLGLTEIDAQMRIAAYVVFDPNDFDSATAELDARYLAGEAAPYAQTWSVIMRAYAAVNRLEAYPTTPSWVQIDHRVETAFGAAELFTYLRAGRGADLQGHTYNEAVHRLGDLGAVITYA